MGDPLRAQVVSGLLKRSSQVDTEPPPAGNPGKIDLDHRSVQTGSLLGEDDIVSIEDNSGSEFPAVTEMTLVSTR